MSHTEFRELRGPLVALVLTGPTEGPGHGKGGGLAYLCSGYVSRQEDQHSGHIQKEHTAEALCLKSLGGRMTWTCHSVSKDWARGCSACV